MKSDTILNLFYEEPQADRWFKYDRYPRRLARRLIRGKQRPGGVMMVALNLMKGLDKLNMKYRFNDFSYIRKHPDELACIIGKPQLLFEYKWRNPILFGAGIFSHPVDCPDLLTIYPNVKYLLVPGEWMREMFEHYYGDKVTAWPTGIDTDKWVPNKAENTYDFLIYNKIRWEYEQYEESLLNPIRKALERKNLTFQEIRYGSYEPGELKAKVNTSRAVIFLCEHETQGIAYQQILSTNTPILAWDRGGFWKDPYYYPHQVQYQPVSSVPYWDERCGSKFKTIEDFEPQLNEFQELLSTNRFNARNYILENLTLEKAAKAYYEIANKIISELK